MRPRIISVLLLAIIFPSISYGVIAGATAPKITYCPPLSKKLYLGVKDPASQEEVKMLQDFLSQFPAIYPQKIVSGNFDSAMNEAVKKFQKTYKLATTKANGLGTVGPKTRDKISKLCSKISEGTSTSTLKDFFAQNGLPKFLKGTVTKKGTDYFIVNVSYYDFFQNKSATKEIAVHKESGDTVEKVNLVRGKVEINPSSWDAINTGNTVQVISDKNKTIQIE